AGGARPGAGGRRRDHPDGRAVLVGGRADPAEVPGGPAPAAPGPAKDRAVRHPQHRGGGLPLRPHRPAHAAAGVGEPAGRAGDRAGPPEPGRDPPGQELPRRRRRDLAAAQAIRAVRYRLRGLPTLLALALWVLVWEAVGRAGLSSIVPPLSAVVGAAPTVLGT